MKKLIELDIDIVNYCSGNFLPSDLLQKTRSPRSDALKSTNQNFPKCFLLNEVQSLREIEKDFKLTPFDWIIFLNSTADDREELELGLQRKTDRFFILEEADITSQSVLGLLPLIEERTSEEFFLYLQKMSYENSNRAFKQAGKMIQSTINSLGVKQDENRLDTVVRIMSFLYHVKLESSLVEDIFELSFLFNRLSMDWELGLNVKVIKNGHVREALRNLRDVDYLFPIEKERNGDASSQVFLVVEFSSSYSDEVKSFISSEMIMEFEYFIFYQKRIEDVQSFGLIWNQSFHSIPLPIALFTQDGELILHNRPFSHLNILPKDCYRLNDEETYEKGEQIYKVLKQDLIYDGKQVYYYIFRPPTSLFQEKQKMGAISSQELGIISSSIAHELNNPIAGILAAISLLGLEENLSDEQVESLQQMKEGAERCRDLIRVFLGFSRVRPDEYSSHGEGKDSKSPVETSLTQALSLLRFRMIESNLRFDIATEVDDRIASGVNSSIMSMIFYLILGDVLTSISHLQLVGHEIEDRKISLILRESSFEISLTLGEGLRDSDFDFSNLNLSKLLRHLVELTEMEIIIASDIIRLKTSEELKFI